MRENADPNENSLDERNGLNSSKIRNRTRRILDPKSHNLNFLLGSTGTLRLKHERYLIHVLIWLGIGTHLSIMNKDTFVK